MKLRLDLEAYRKSVEFMEHGPLESWLPITRHGSHERLLPDRRDAHGRRGRERTREKERPDPQYYGGGHKGPLTGKVAAKPAPETPEARLGHTVEGHVSDAVKYPGEDASHTGLSNRKGVNHSVRPRAYGQRRIVPGAAEARACGSMPPGVPGTPARKRLCRAAQRPSHLRYSGGGGRFNGNPRRGSMTERRAERDGSIPA